MDQLACMRVFVRVVEQGAFVRAAEDLGISRASVTTAVAQLEAHLGVRLLNRTTRRLSLTEEGRAYYEDCVRILGQISEAEDSLGHARLAPRGRLRVSIAPSFEALEFFPLLADFMRRHPALSVDVVVTDRALNLVEEGIDCALRATDISPDAMLVARRLSEVRWLVCGAPDYLAQFGMPRTIDELAAHNCLRFISPSTGRVREWQFATPDGPIHVMPQGRLWLSSLDAAVAAAQAGIGLAQVPDALAARAVLDGRLLPVLTGYITSAQPLMLVYPANRYLPARVRAFAEFVQRAYPREGWWPRLEARVLQGCSLRSVDVA